MNFGLIPAPAGEELELDYVPSASSVRTPAVLYFLALLTIFQFSLDERSSSALQDTAQASPLPAASSGGAQARFLSRQTKD